ncbi:MAG TPA: nuclear transport factor 2 family protein [Chitinophagaceae bacterium]|nr:nuclear transport factor 2 family protein [Chitinophagaceae bacterium]
MISWILALGLLPGTAQAQDGISPVRVQDGISLVRTRDSIALVRMVESKFDMLNHQDVEGASELYADSAKIRSIGFPDTLVGPPGFRSVYQRYFTTTPDLHFDLTRCIVAGHTLVVEYQTSGTVRHVEDPASSYMIDKPYSLENCTIMEVRKGKIVSEMTYFDQVSFLRQVGYFARNY